MSSKLDPAAPQGRKSTATLLAGLIASNAQASDILALAQALAPFDQAASKAIAGHQGKSLLRLAIERDPPMDLSTLDALASTHATGSAQAWALSNQPPLANLLIQRLSRNGYRSSQLSSDLATRIVELSSEAQLKSAPGDESLAEALLSSSSANDLGIAPFLTLASKLGKTMADATISDGSPAILKARCMAAFDAFLSAGGDPRLDVDGAPLWEKLRENATRQPADKDLLERLDDWAKTNEADRENAREKRLYFALIGRYGGDAHLKKRKDWHQIVDDNGRTALMALCLGNSSHVKSFWSIKKSEPAAALSDHDGRTLWHAILAHGKDCQLGSAAYLAEHVPLAPDAKGRGLLPSLWAMRDDNDRPYSEHEWLFDGAELGRACAFAPSAHAWLACPDPVEALAFGHWLANDRYLGPLSDSSFSGIGKVRSVKVLTHLAMRLDSASFGSIPAPIAGALAFNLAFSDSGQYEAKSIAQKIAEILAQGAHVELDAAREKLLDRVKPALSTMIRAAFGAARESRILADSIGSTRAHHDPIRPRRI